MTDLRVIKEKINQFTDSRFEQAIARVAPGVAKKRLQNMVERYLVASNWQGASKVSAEFEKFSVGITDADSSLDYGERDLLVNRSRDHVRNVPVASGIISRLCDHAIGPNGLTFHPQIDAKILGMSPEQKAAWEQKTEARFRLFAETHECDFARQLNFYEKTYQTLKSQLEGGDCFTVLTNLRRPGSPFGLKLQTVEGEMVSNPDLQQNSATLVDGIEKDVNSTPVKYHFSKYHPGNIRTYGQNQSWFSREIFGKHTGARKILHHFVQLRPGQSRGVPVLGPVTGKLLQINRYSKAELLAAVLNSYYTLIITGEKNKTGITKKAPTASSTAGANEKISLGSGSVFRIGPNEKIEAFDPGRPSHRYLPFWEAMILEIGAHCGIPKSIILMTFDKSYSASRGEVILFWVTVLAHRVRTAIGFCQPGYEAFLDEEVANGNIYAPGYFKNPLIQKAYRGSGYNQWTGPVREAIDELKEAKANEIKIKGSKTKSRKMVTAETTGKDWESSVYQQLQKEAALLGENIIEDIDIELTPEEEADE